LPDRALIERIDSLVKKVVIPAVVVDESAHGSRSRDAIVKVGLKSRT